MLNILLELSTVATTNYKPDSAAAAAGGMFILLFYCLFMALLILFIVAVQVLWIMLSIWVYRDAKQKGSTQPELWGIMVYFVGIIGLLLYFLVERNKLIDQ